MFSTGTLQSLKKIWRVEEPLIPIFFSSGNWAGDGFYDFPGVAYPAWLPDAFSVGAVQLDDYRWEYSSYGVGLDIVAPSGETSHNGDVWGLDQMSYLGNNPPIYNCPPDGGNYDYVCNFGGTSAALQ